MTDKFYTLPNISKKCLDTLENFYKWSDWDFILEPSAGDGSFYNIIPFDNKLGIDIDPENENIKQQDFFTFTPDEKFKNILVIGNPPFGRVSSLAIKFFNHSAKWANVIAFIIPRTFRRLSVQNKLNKFFHLKYDESLTTNPCCFDPPMNAKCCFQIWEKKNIERECKKLKIDHEDFDFLHFGPKDDKNQPTPPIGSDFAIRAYGGKCGQIMRENLHTLRPKSWHWIKSNIDVETLIKRFESIDYSISNDTVRQNSIGKADLINLYSELYD